MTSSSLDRVARVLLLGVLVLLGVVALMSAHTRHLHIDEAHNVYTMQLAMLWHDAAAGSPVELYHVVGGLLTRALPHSIDQYLWLRGICSVVFVAMLVGVGALRTIQAREHRSVVVVLGAAALALSMGSAWRHGYEIRHDLVLGVFLVVFLAVLQRAQQKPYAWPTRLVAAVCVVVMQLDSHKAITLWGPALLGLALLHGRHLPTPQVFRLRMRDLALESARLALACVVVGACGLLAMQAAGALDAYLERLIHFASYSTGAERFSPFGTLRLLVTLSPVACVLAAWGVAAAVRQLAREFKQRGLVAADDVEPAVVMLCWSMLALLINPTPYPYNLTWLSVAVAAVAGIGLYDVAQRAGQRAPATIVAIVVLSCVAFGVGTRSGWFSTSMQQQRLTITAIEALTSTTTPVLDGSGLVTSRPAPSRDWILHSLFMAEYMARKRERVAEMVHRTAPPVVVRGHYRWRWLPDDDIAAVDARYVPLSPTLSVLGADLTAPNDVVVPIYRPGRYEVRGASHINDAAVPNIAVVDANTALRVRGPARVTVRWLGPTLGSLDELTLPTTSSLYESANAPGTPQSRAWRRGVLVDPRAATAP